MLKHSFVLKTERFDSVFAQEFLVSLPVLFRHGHVIVVITIKFNGKFQSRTVKVQDMMANTELTTKLEASNLLAFQPVPKSSFGWSPISAEFPSVGFHLGSIENVDNSFLLVGFQRPLAPSNLRGGIVSNLHI